MTDDTKKKPACKRKAKGPLPDDLIDQLLAQLKGIVDGWRGSASRRTLSSLAARKKASPLSKIRLSRRGPPCAVK